MTSFRKVLPFCVLLTFILQAAAQKKNFNKEAIIKSIDSRKAEATDMSEKIWAYAETGLKESQSSKLLADYAEVQGFTVQRGVAQMPTAFTAS